MVYQTTFNQITIMKHYKDDCHHYKVINKHRAVTVTLLGGVETTINYANYGGVEHEVMDYIRDKTVTPCTEAEYQTAFDKALNTINNLK